MTLDELLYECGEMYKRLPPETQPASLAAPNSYTALYARLLIHTHPTQLKLRWERAG